MRWTVRQHVVAMAIVLGVTAVTYGGVLGNGFVYDDVFTVEKNPAVRSVSRAAEWIASPYAVSADRSGTNYRPVVVTSYGIDYAIWGERAAGFHLTNLLLHLGVVGLVFALGRRLWGTDLPGVIAATWMAIHPINSEAVNYITARSSVLAAGGLLASTYCYDRWIGGRSTGDDSRSSAWAAGALAFGLFALGAKEAAVILPLLILVWDRARFGVTVGLRTSVRRSAPFWGLLGVWLLLRHTVVGNTPQPVDLSEMSWGWLVQGMAFGAKIVNTAVGQSLWPVGLAVDYGWPTALSAGATIGAAVVLTGIAAASWLVVRLDRRMAYCAVWFGVSLVPVLALPFMTRIALYQEHRVYVAEIGLAWLVGGVVWGAASRFTWGIVGRVVLAGAALSLVVAAVSIDRERTRVWGDKIRLWNDVLAKYPDSAVAHGEKGTWLFNDGRVDEAEQAFLAALRVMPSYVYPYLMLGMTYSSRGEIERAVAAYRTALELRPRFVEARIRLGLAYEERGLVERALVEYDRALQDDPRASPAWVLSAAILERRGQSDEAIRRLRQVAQDDPVYDDAQLRLGALQLRLEQWGEARQTLTSLLARNPTLSEARYYLNVVEVEERARNASHGDASR